MSDKEKSYRNTALLGVSSVVNILLSVIRNKVFSIYLGPAGIGQFGILNDFINSIFTVGTLGVGNSGVQAVSKASVESGDAVKKVFNSLLFAFSIISVLLVTAIFIFAGHISQSLAGNDTYIIYLRIAAFALLFKFRTSIQSILINGFAARNFSENRIVRNNLEKVSMIKSRGMMSAIEMPICWFTYSFMAFDPSCTLVTRLG